MVIKNWNEFVKEERSKYRKLGYVKCPAFNNEEVYFNHYGFNHLISKGKKLRPKEQVIERFQLLSYAFNIVQNTKIVYNEEKRTKGESAAYFWTIRAKVGSKNIRIILRRLEEGTIHFFSIMKE